MKYIAFANTIHEFRKENLITITYRGQSYDKYRCTKCGLTGKRFGFSEVLSMDNKTSDIKIARCNGEHIKPVFVVPKRIKILSKPNVMNNAFDNCTEDSEHDVIETPAKYIDIPNNDSGVWIMGVGEPVRILTGEYKAI